RRPRIRPHHSHGPSGRMRPPGGVSGYAAAADRVLAERGREVGVSPRDGEGRLRTRRPAAGRRARAHGDHVILIAGIPDETPVSQVIEALEGSGAEYRVFDQRSVAAVHMTLEIG